MNFVCFWHIFSHFFMVFYDFRKADFDRQFRTRVHVQSIPAPYVSVFEIVFQLDFHRQFGERQGKIFPTFLKGNIISLFKYGCRYRLFRVQQLVQVDDYSYIFIVYSNLPYEFNPNRPKLLPRIFQSSPIFFGFAFYQLSIKGRELFYLFKEKLFLELQLFQLPFLACDYLCGIYL